VTIIDGFLLHAKHQPTAPTICAPGWNYGRLLAFANNVASHALAAGVKRGDVVAIFAKDPIFHSPVALSSTPRGPEQRGCDRSSRVTRNDSRRQDVIS
jgi:non-ribosomal peptide synthetase component F